MSQPNMKPEELQQKSAKELLPSVNRTQRKNLFPNRLIIGVVVISAIVTIAIKFPHLFNKTAFSLDQNLEELYLDGEGNGHLVIYLKDGVGDYFTLPDEPGDASELRYKVMNYDPKSGKLDLLEYIGEMIDVDDAVIYDGSIDKEGNYSGIITDLSGNKLDNFIFYRDQKYYDWQENHSIEENVDEVKPYNVEYTGTIANQRVQMHLNFYPSGVVEGRYMYNKYGAWIDLNGICTTDKIIMTERDSNGNTGTFILRKETDDDNDFRIAGGRIINSRKKSYDVNLSIKD